jgi:hypothetical protein
LVLLALVMLASCDDKPATSSASIAPSAVALPSYRAMVCAPSGDMARIERHAPEHRECRR